MDAGANGHPTGRRRETSNRPAPPPPRLGISIAIWAMLLLSACPLRLEPPGRALRYAPDQVRGYSG